MKYITVLHRTRMLFVLGISLALMASMGPAWAAGKKAASADETGACPVTLLENKDFFPALIKAIDEAKHEIFISIFSFKAGVHPNSYPDQLLAGLGRAAKRGVQVKVILEVASDRTNDLTRQNMKTKTLLEEKGVTVYLDSPKKTTHTKLVLVDEHSVFMGSHNFTSSALKHNNEISVLIEQPQLARKVRNYMLKIMKEAK